MTMSSPANKKPIVWSVAGSDSGGGAGIQADLHTIAGLGGYACTVVTAITSQNSVQVCAIEPVAIEPQLAALAADMPARVIKIGMLANIEQVKQLAQQLRHYKQHWPQPPLVVYDPVMVASSGDRLNQEDLCAAIHSHLLPCVDLLTPNSFEAEQLSGETLTDADSRARAAQKILDSGCRAVVLTGGHLDENGDTASDYYFDAQRNISLHSPRQDSPHNHGSGCVFASATATLLALDYPVEDALVLAKTYVNRGFSEGVAIGAGRGPLAHTGWPNQLEYFPALNSAPLASAFPDCGTRELGLYPVVDSADWIEKLLKCGVKTLQLRIKEGSAEQIEQQIMRSIQLGRDYQARVFINDYWQLAIKHQSYGVHLGQEDLAIADLDAIRAAGLRLGISTHGYYEILRAHACRPSYIAVGAIYATTTKEMPSKPQGLNKLRNYVQLLTPHYPLVAIGGISIKRAADVWAQQPGCIALVSAITKAENYQQAVQELMSITGESYVQH